MNDTNIEQLYTFFDTKVPEHGSKVVIKDGNGIEFNLWIMASDLKYFKNGTAKEKGYCSPVLGYCRDTNTYFHHGGMGAGHCKCKGFYGKNYRTGEPKFTGNENKFFNHYDMYITEAPYSWRYAKSDI